MKTVSYKGYQASVEYEDGSLFVKVLHIDDVLVGECNAASEAPTVLAELIEGYLEDCAELGREPTKPFKGSFNVRISPDMHRKIAMDAASKGVSLNAWIIEAASEKLECDGWGTRIDGVVSKSQTQILQWVHEQAARINTYNTPHLRSFNRSSATTGQSQENSISRLMSNAKFTRALYHG